MTTTQAETTPAPMTFPGGPIERSIRLRMHDEQVRRQKTPRLFVPRDVLGQLFAELGGEYEPMRNRLFQTADGDAVCELDKVKLVVDFAPAEVEPTPVLTPAAESARVDELEAKVASVDAKLDAIMALLQGKAAN